MPCLLDVEDLGELALELDREPAREPPGEGELDRELGWEPAWEPPNKVFGGSGVFGT